MQKQITFFPDNLLLVHGVPEQNLNRQQESNQLNRLRILLQFQKNEYINFGRPEKHTHIDTVINCEHKR